jgi:hypothetical protein
MQREHTASVRAVVLTVAVLLCGNASAEPMQSAEEPTQATDGEVIAWPEGEPLDFSTPTPEEMRASALAKAKKPFAAEPASDLQAKAGVDYRRPAVPGLEFQPDHLLAGTLADQSPGTAWADVTTAGPLGWDKATVGTRLDPAQDQGKVATMLSRSIPLGDNLGLTLQNGVAVSRTFAAPGVSGSAAAQSWSTSQAVKFNILPSDTTVSVGANLATSDDKWLRTLSAEQKLFDGLSVTGSVSETPGGEPAKSLRAGFKRTW